MSRIGQFFLLLALGCPRPAEDPGYDLARLAASAYVDAAQILTSDAGDAGSKEHREAGPLLGDPHCDDEPDETPTEEGEDPPQSADPDFPLCLVVEDEVFDKKITLNKRRVGDKKCCYRPIVTVRPPHPQKVRSYDRDYE